jgi:hypothetical protein
MRCQVVHPVRWYGAKRRRNRIEVPGEVTQSNRLQLNRTEDSGRTYVYHGQESSQHVDNQGKEWRNYHVERDRRFLYQIGNPGS